MKSTKKITLRSRLLALTMAAAMTLSLAGLSAGERTYTLNSDFSDGTLVNLDMTTVPNQLQLSQEQSTLPFIWVPNQNNTLSKLDTRTGKELARYYLGPASGFNGQPSRTTVDLMGNCWVGNRYAGSVVKVGLAENGAGIDRNSNGKIDTCVDLNDDGTISPSEMLPWGEDECVLFEVLLLRNNVGTYVPGTYTGAYPNDWGDVNDQSPGPRSLAVDKFNNCWVGCLGTRKFYYIDGNTGAILRTVDVSSPWNHRSYGATIDAQGRIWSVSHGQGQVLRMVPDPVNPASGPLSITSIGVNHVAYGINVDGLGHVFCSGWDQGYSRLNAATGGLEWRKYVSYDQSRGVAVTKDNDVWIANTAYSRIFRFDNNGNLKATLTGMGLNQPTGVAVDADGKVWVCNLADDKILRINPENNQVDLVKEVVGSWGHYTYSDMTGVTVRNVTRKVGNWTVIHDSGMTAAPWGWVTWTGLTPDGTAIDVRVRSSEDQSTWSGWETVNGTDLATTPPGRYLQVETTLSGPGGVGTATPILYDLTVGTGCLPPIAGYKRLSNTGYYVQLLAASECYQDLQIYIKDPLTTFVAGPYAPGDIVRITRTATTPTATPGRAPVKEFIYLNKGAAKIYAVDPENQVSPEITFKVR